jgi:hypothetical protein
MSYSFIRRKAIDKSTNKYVRRPSNRHVFDIFLCSKNMKKAGAEQASKEKMEKIMLEK